jgi:hypothetical protein
MSFEEERVCPEGSIVAKGRCHESKAAALADEAHFVEV